MALQYYFARQAGRIYSVSAYPLPNSWESFLLPYPRDGCTHISTPGCRCPNFQCARCLQGLASKNVHGFPVNTMFTDFKSLTEKVRATNIHLTEADDVRFSLSVRVFPYPQEVYSIWVFLLSISPRAKVVWYYMYFTLFILYTRAVKRCYYVIKWLATKI